ncbi:hypothetical protein LOC67_01500 [Stieleria sp. JC731]|uniref:O-linked N-acetylglucosamine transferase, SPINDLY family protein n=1 Tax=Pirellulaceae TaxID=2691357 RepID=UPI001E32293C|nr:hypothetical protein [Stieleria sp. JC731]MCC9599218.1 hypothetical protein [Stieleria sp. JC731]
MVKRPKRRKPNLAPLAIDDIPSGGELSGWLAKQTYPPAALRQAANDLAASDRTLDALYLLDHLIGRELTLPVDWKTTGQLLCRLGEFAQGIDALQKYERFVPHDPEGNHDLGRAFYKLGRTSLAQHYLRNAIRLSSELSPLLALATMIPGASDASQHEILFCRTEFAKQLGQSDPPLRLITENQESSPNRPTPIGFISSWFDKENYMKPVWALINHLNRDRFIVHFFDDTDSDEQGRPPGYQEIATDVWHATSSRSNADLAKLIADSDVQIAIDLNAYSTPHRLGLFNKRFSPVQAAWFNMYATSGLPELDYIIGDHVTVKPDEDQFYSESVARLNQSYLTFSVTHQAPPLVEPPVTHSGHVTFGSLVTFYKITPAVIKAWSNILQRTANSRLLLGNAELKSKHNGRFLLDQFETNGISPDRIQLLGPAPHDQFLRYYDQIDIALDAFPYNGGTTTMEAIWQGVPVITFDGDRWASRTSASLLAETPFAEFIAEDIEGYVETAVQLATAEDRDSKLTELRRSCRTQLESSTVCDAQAFARDMESLFVSWL